MSSTAIIGWLGVIVSSIEFVPQIVRLLATRNTRGISPLFWTLVAVQTTTWIFYGYIEDIIPVTVVNTIVLTGACIVLYLMDLRLDRKYSVAGIIFLTTAFCYVLVNQSQIDFLGNVALSLSIIVWLPQARVALVRRDLSGLSVSSWTLVLVSSSLWLFYGHLISDWRVQVPALTAASAALIVVYRIIHTRYRSG